MRTSKNRTVVVSQSCHQPVGVVEKKKIIDGKKIKPGNLLVGLASSGLHSNGYSLVRKALFEKAGYGVEDTLTELGHMTLGEVTRNPADGGHADAREPVDLAVGKALLQPLDHGPAIGDGLQLGRRAQVAEEGTAFVDRLEGQHGGKQAALRERFLAGGYVAVLFHGLMY